MATTGCYLLAVVAEPVSDEEKNIILQRLNKGLLSWDLESTGCDLKGIENICASIEGKDVQDNDVLIQYSTESLGVEILVNPPVSTLKQCVKNLLTSNIGHKHIIHAGYTFTGSGSWILQNGAYSYDDFASAFEEVKSVCNRGSTIHLHCVETGDWTSENFAKDVFSKIANVRLNPADKLDHLPGSEHLVGCLESVLSTQSLTDSMEASNLVGNIRFNRPTLYLFPAGEGDCALFGINGFNMLIDGGFNRKPCSWDFIRHLDRLDAVLVTQLSESNLCSMSTLMKRKTLNSTYPQIGYVFCNIAEGKDSSPTEEVQKDVNDLLVSVVGEGHKFIHTLNDLKLVPHQCWRDSVLEPFVLYHKVGHGTLEMHILSPPKSSKEMTDFLAEWSACKERFSCVKFKGQKAPIPLTHATSVCSILVWRPNDPKDTITRILFPGSAPQSKIFEGLEKIKSLDILKHPTVTKASLNTIPLSKPKVKTTPAVAKAAVPNRKITASPVHSVTGVASRNGDISAVKKDLLQVKDNKTFKEVKKVTKEVKKDVKAVKEVKKEIKEVKKEVKKEPKKEAKKEPKKEAKPVTEKSGVKISMKKVESTKTAADVKKTTTTKKPAAKKDSVLKQVTKSVEKLETKKLAKPETKTAKEVTNKKAAEAKTKTKTKTNTSTTNKAKATPVSKSPSKITRAIAASAAVATAAVAVGVAEFIESKREEAETEEILKIEIEEPIANNVPEELQNGVEIDEAEVAEEVEIAEEAEEDDHNIELPASPVRQEILSPALSEPVSLTASDTLSSAPMETVSPTPPIQDIISPAEEKEVNEIKEIDQQTPVDYEGEYFPEQEDRVPTPVYDEDGIESAVDEGIEEDNVEDKIDNEIVAPSEEVKHEVPTDVMSTSFYGESLEAADQEKCTHENVLLEEASYNNSTKNFEIEDAEQTNKLDDNHEEIYVKIESKDTIEKEQDYHDIDSQLASATMEDSFCAGMTPQNFVEEPDDALMSNSEIPNIMKTSMYEEKEESNVNDDYVQKIINQYSEPVDDDLGNVDGNGYEQKVIDNVKQKDIETIEDTRKHGAPPPEFHHEEDQNVLHESDIHEQQEDKNDMLISQKYDVNDFKNQMYENPVDEIQNNVLEPVDIEFEVKKSYAYETDVSSVKQASDSHNDYMQDDLMKEQPAVKDFDKIFTTQSYDHPDYAKETNDIYDEHNQYETEGKQRLEEKDHDSAEEDDGEMIRHPTPPEFYHHDIAEEDEMRDPIGQHYIPPSAFMTMSSGAKEPLYEEAEESASDRSESPVEEQPIFSSVDKVNFPELVTVSGGTTPSEPQSPKYPQDKKGSIDVMYTLDEDDSSLVRDGTNVLETTKDAHIGCLVQESSDSHFFSEKQTVDTLIDTNIAYNTTETESQFDCRTEEESRQTDKHESNTEHEMKCEFKNDTQVEVPCKNEENIAYETEPNFTDELLHNNEQDKYYEREDHSTNLETNIVTDVQQHCDSDNEQLHIPPPLSEYSSNLEDFQTQSENKIASEPLEFASSHSHEEHVSSEKDMDFGDQYYQESSTYATESTEQNNRYSSASTVELENSKHSNENVSNVGLYDSVPPSSYQTENYQDERFEQIEADRENSFDAHHSSEGLEKPFTEDPSYYPNGYDETKPNSDFDIEHPTPHSESSVPVNGERFKSNDPNDVDCTNNITKPSAVDSATQEVRESAYITDSHYQSDSPESDNSMKPDTPEILSQSDSENERQTFDGVNNKYLYNQAEYPYEVNAPPAEFGVINSKYNFQEEYTADNMNNLSAVPNQPKLKCDQTGRRYEENSDDDESSSVPGNVSPYAYTNEAYNQEDDADGNHIYKPPNVGDLDTIPPYGSNSSTYQENTGFESHQVASGIQYTSGYSDMHPTDTGYDFRLEEWGKPMGLPTPPVASAKTKKPLKPTPSSIKTVSKTAEKKPAADNGKLHPVAAKLPSSPSKKAKDPQEAESKPVYVDLAYVPHHGDPNYSDVEFFKKIRARYYVFSGISPSKEVLNALLEAKKSWKENQEVTIIPTYETDALGYWLAQNQDTLAANSIDVAPSASRCTVNLQDHETSCAAYRLEF